MINKPPGLPFLVVFSAAAAVLLTWAGHPSWLGLETFVHAVPVGLVLFVYWAIRVVWADHKGALPEGIRSRTLMPWYVAGVVLIALMTEAPSWVRFTLSESSMEAYVESVNENPRRAEACQWVGLYYACGGMRHQDATTGEEFPGSVEFAVRDLFLDDGKGFLWLPSGEPSESSDGGNRYSHLEGRWYSYRWEPDW
ncbi:hypothetical protein FXF51_06765 [Nonomuraea sp. PA05]|uniref:hypothetical protein n=1 Tax=Nonomuraea sp. PA05 TaxID=2604466 RepID=UPI0011D41584|nr:hypothetical protein [Nonomuraea sp. PA05]TYB69853.1 hypothetical protein FXF51_06765 [Nonomuraea sp. PA05]